MKNYHLSAPTIDQLQTVYFRQFGEGFPLAQYMSLYDSFQASDSKNLLSQEEATARPNPVVLQTTAGRIATLHDNTPLLV